VRGGCISKRRRAGRNPRPRRQRLGVDVDGLRQLGPRRPGQQLAPRRPIKAPRCLPRLVRSLGPGRQPRLSLRPVSVSLDPLPSFPLPSSRPRFRANRNRRNRAIRRISLKRSPLCGNLPHNQILSARLPRGRESCNGRPGHAPRPTARPSARPQRAPAARRSRSGRGALRAPAQSTTLAARVLRLRLVGRRVPEEERPLLRARAGLVAMRERGAMHRPQDGRRVQWVR